MRAIDADKLREKKVLVYSCFGAEAEGVLLEDIDNAPTITPDSLVKRGRWEEHPSGDPMCSECKELLTTEQYLHGGNKFCPYCGAMMDESGALMED